jgi:ABC-type polysaccharide/polyol phosphate export permease
MMNDISRMLEFAFQFGMFLTPTVYPTPVLSEANSVWQQGLYWLHTANPVTHFIHGVHALIETGTFHPDRGFCISLVMSVLMLAIGWRFFHICEPMLAERL